MRFKPVLPKPLQWLLFLGYIIFILRIIAENKLGFFVNPNYSYFIIAMCVIGVAFAGLAAVGYLKKMVQKKPPAAGHNHKHESPLGILDVIVILVLMSTATIVTQPLLSRAALQRSNVNSATPLKLETSRFDPQQPRDYLEWSYVLDQNGQSYLGREVTLIGFVSPIYTKTQPEAFALTRFFISCCAVDAAPLDIPIAYAGWRTTIAPDQWVKVTGVVSAITVDGKPRYGLVASEVVQTQEPDDPYLYRR